MSDFYGLGDDLLEFQNKATGLLSRFAVARDDLGRGAAPSVSLDDYWQILTEAEFFSSLVPKALGGSGAGVLPMVLCVEQAGIVGITHLLPALTAVATLAIAQHGNDELKSEFLPEIAAGRRKVCFASTEAEAGCNVFRTKTQATTADDGYLLSGEKIYISSVDDADFLLVVARTSPLQEKTTSRGMSLFLVDKNAKGLSFEQMATRGEGDSKQFRVRFEAVPVPASRMVGERDRGAGVMFSAFNPERLIMASLLLGIGRYAMDAACIHARNRRVFGDQPIGAYQSLQHPLADAKVREDMVRLLIYRSARAFDRGADPHVAMLRANSAKYAASEFAVKAVDAAIHTFGGKGFDEEYGIIHLWETVRLFQTAPISNALILNAIAQHGLGLPKSS